MEKEYAEITEAENTAIAEFESLVAAKNKEIAAATTAIEVKTEKNGELAVSIVNFKNDLADAQEAFGEDEVFLAELKKGCAVAQKEYDARVKMRSEESVGRGVRGPLRQGGGGDRGTVRNPTRGKFVLGWIDANF